jgi:hypothetical protein
MNAYKETKLTINNRAWLKQHGETRDLEVCVHCKGTGEVQHEDQHEDCWTCDSTGLLFLDGSIPKIKKHEEVKS